MTDRKPAPPEKHMAKVTLGFEDYVLPIGEATTILRALEKAERYDVTFRRSEDGGPMHHVWSEAPRARMELIDYNTYLQGKFTGKSEK